ncbi:MAG: glycosyltransferase family 39 protein [Elusimicrobiota bacterium]
MTKRKRQNESIQIKSNEDLFKKKNIIAFFFLIIISYFTLKTYFLRFPINIEAFISSLNPFEYLTLNIYKTAYYNLKEISKMILLLLSILGWGNIAIKISKINEDTKENLILKYALGLCIISAFSMLTGFLGLIKTTLYIGFLTTGIFIWFYYFIKSGYKIKTSFKTDIISNKIFFIIFLIIVVINLVQSLAPEIFYDTLVYHLGVPKWWFLEGKIKDMQYNIYSKLTLNHSVIYLFSLVNFGEQTPLLANFLTSIFCFIAIGWGFRKYITEKTSLTAAIIFYSIFHVSQSSQSATSDIIAAFFIIISFYSMIKYTETGRKIWLIYTGLFCGLAFGTKYNTAFIIIAIFLINIYKQIKEKRLSFKQTLIETLLFSAFFSVFTFPWLVKNFLNYSNPLFPFAYSIFNKNLSSIDTDKINGLMLEIKQFQKFDFISWIKHPFLISTGQIPNSEFFTPLFMLVLPLGLFNKKRKEFLAYLWLTFGFSWFMWSFSSTTIRHLFSSYFAASIIAAYYINEAFYGITQKMLKFLFYLILISTIYWLILSMKNEGRYLVVTGVISKDEYLSVSHPRYPNPSYAVYKYINENLKTSDRILIIGDSKTFYLDRRFEASSVFDRNLLIDTVITSKKPQDIYLKLKEKGITHILLNVNEAFRTNKGYNIFYWEPGEISKFHDFFNKHLSIEKDYEKIADGRYLEKVILYRLVENNQNPSVDYISQISNLK